MLTVELRETGEVEIYCDQDGLKVLERKLNILNKEGGHVHLMTPSWAGYELTEDKQGVDTSLIHHLRITLKSDNFTPQ